MIMAEKRTRSQTNPNHTAAGDSDNDPSEWFRRTHAALVERMAGRVAMLGEHKTKAAEIRRFTAELGRRTAALLRDTPEGKEAAVYGRLSHYVVGKIHRPDSERPKDENGKVADGDFNPVMEGWFLKRSGNVGGSLPMGYFLTTDGTILRYSVSEGVYNNKLDKKTNTRSSLPHNDDAFKSVTSAVMVLHDDPSEDYLPDFRNQRSFRPEDAAHAVYDDLDLQAAMATLLDEQGLTDQLMSVGR